MRDQKKFAAGYVVRQPRSRRCVGGSLCWACRRMVSLYTGLGVPHPRVPQAGVDNWPGLGEKGRSYSRWSRISPCDELANAAVLNV